ncbi:MAG: PilW family protein [Vicinamibacterales bacterium]
MRGFSAVEVLIATLLVVTMLSAVAGVVNRALAFFDTQPEVADLQQRLRVSVWALQRELAMAGAGPSAGAMAGPLNRHLAPVMPYRAGAENPDPPGTFRRDVISVIYVPPGAVAELSRHTYYLRADALAGTCELMHYDGAVTDLPVADHVVKLEFGYFAEGPAELDPATFTDGPWLPDDVHPGRFDADLLRIRRIRVTVRVQAGAAWLRGPASRLFMNPGTGAPSRSIPDQELTFDVSPRNLDLER